MRRRLAVFLLLLPLVMACTGPGNVVGNVAPDFTLEMVDGTKLSMAELKGKPTMIYFFASW